MRVQGKMGVLGCFLEKRERDANFKCRNCLREMGGGLRRVNATTVRFVLRRLGIFIGLNEYLGPELGNFSHIGV